MSRRSFLTLAGSVTLGGVLIYLEGDSRIVVESEKSEILKGSRFLEEIEGIEIFVDQEIPDTDDILVKVLKNLRKMLSFLPKELTREVSLIRLKSISNKEYNVGGLAYMQIGAIQMNVLIDDILKWDESTIEKVIANVLFHEITHLVTYKKYSSFSSEIRARTYIICRSPSNEVCKNFFTYLVATRDLDTWLSISRDNGDYLNIEYNNENIPLEEFERKNFGYVLEATTFRYGVLNLLEDIACVFQQVIYRLYLVYKKGEYTGDYAKTAIVDLLAETPGETGLWKKYQIACNSLIRLFEDAQKQELDQTNKTKLENLIPVLKVFSNQIEAAILGELTKKEQLPNQQPMLNEAGGSTQFDPNSQGNQQIAVIVQRGPQSSTPITRREFLQESLRQLFVRGGGRRII